MNGFRSMLEVARWEFLRFVKPKQQLFSLLLTFAIIMGINLFTELRGAPSTLSVAVIGAEHLPTLPEEAGRLEFRLHAPSEEPALRASLENGDIDGLLILSGDGGGELVTPREPGWLAELERELTVAKQLSQLLDAGVGLDDLAAFYTPFALEVHETSPRGGGPERVAATIALAMVMVGLFSGIGYIFASVTGEKQNRLSEQVVSAIPAQSWIDGKILGLSAVSMVIILNVVVAVLLSMLASQAIWGSSLPLPTSFENPGLLVFALLLILLGYLFWFSFLTAVAALVEDPNSSARSQLLMLPVVAVVPGFFVAGDPDALWVQVLGMLPPFSAAVMPARVLVTDVPWWEIGVAVIGLVAATWAMRRLAGKIFRLAMLMYGKEPSWGEVRRWIREA